MRLIDADKLYNWVRRECNPYGKPTIDFESGNRMLEMIKRSSTAFDREKVIRPEQENGEVTLDGMNMNRTILGLAAQRLSLKTKRKEN